MPIFFTPNQANAHLAQVREITERVLEIKKKAELETEDEAVTDAMEELEKEVQKLEDLGCVLKDMGIGLVDFPAVRLGRRVWLCWRMGEKNVSFWHGLNEGFAARKPVEQEEFYDDDLAIRALAREVLPKPHA